jgi:16S rRNA (cytosine1402-N4)-methyltransferase
MISKIHIPVLRKEVLYYLDPKPNENFIDCTIGGGGHTSALIKKILPNGKILGIDRDPEIIDQLKIRNQKIRNKDNLILICDNFANLGKIVKKQKFNQVSGVLFDLGLSSWHLEEAKRGFSFLRDEKLDMRYNPKSTFLTAEEIINKWPQGQIENILEKYGEEDFAKIISRKIVEARKIKIIKTTSQLVEIIRSSVPKWYLRQRKHFAAKTFQALRITVNGELNNLEKVLPQAIKILKKGGRLVIISFHSLEDRIVKNFFRSQAKFHNKKNLYYGAEEGLPTEALAKAGLSAPYSKLKQTVLGVKILTKKPIRPSEEEIIKNPRSRSAKLRAVIKL